MGIFKNGAQRTGVFTAGSQVNGVFSGGVNRLTGAGTGVAVDGTAAYSAYTIGRVTGGSLTGYSLGPFTYSPLTAGPSVEFINQTGRASVTANYAGASRVDTRVCELVTPPTGTGMAGRCSSPDNAIGGGDSRTVTGLTRTLAGFAPTSTNGGLVTRRIPNPAYVASAVPPSIRITNAVRSFTRPSTFAITYTTTPGDSPIASVTFIDDNAFWDVSTTGVVTALAVGTATITATVTDTAGNIGTATIFLTASNPVAPTIFVRPKTRSIAGVGGAGLAFIVSATGTDIEVTTSSVASWLTVNPNGTWSASENTGDARSDVVRFTVRDALNQSAFNDVTISQAAAAATVECFTYTFTRGSGGTQISNIGSYVLCDGTVASNQTIANGFSACIQEGTALVPTGGTGRWSKGPGC